MPRLRRSVIDVAGGFQKSGNADDQSAHATGVSVPDPLAGLRHAGPTGLTTMGR